MVMPRWAKHASVPSLLRKARSMYGKQEDDFAFEILSMVAS
jgi:hypothetical protein